MSVYDREKPEGGGLLDKPSDDDLRKSTGIGADEESAMEREAFSGAAEDIAAREGLGSGQPGSRATQDETDKLDDKTDNESENPQEDSLFNDDGSPKKKIRYKLTGKIIAGGGAGVLGLGSIAAILAIASGPLTFIHLANLMDGFHFGNNEEFNNSRLSRLYRWAKGTGYRNNLGRVGNHFADKIDTRMRNLGIEPEYNNRGLAHLDFDTNNPDARAALERMRTKGYEPVDIGEGKFRLEADLSSRDARSATRTMFSDVRESLGENKIANAVTSRIARKRYAGGFHPLRNFLRDRGEQLRDYVRSVRQAHEDAQKTGTVEERGPPRTQAEEEDAQSRAARQAGDEIGGETDEIIGDGKPTTISTNLKKAFAVTAGLVGLAELTCNLDTVGDGIQLIRQAQVVEPLMRIGLDSISIGSQLQVGIDVNADEVGALFENFFGETAIGNLSAFSADSIKAEEGEEQIGERTDSEGNKVRPADLPSSSKPGRDRPAFFGGIDALKRNLDSALPAGTSDSFCDFITLSDPTGTFSVADLIDGVLTAVTDGGYAVAASGITAIAFSVGGILGQDFIDSFVNWLADAALQCAPGPQWGSCVNVGSRLAGNDQALGSGGRELTDAEELALDYNREQLEQYDMKTKSLYARYIDPRETHSLFASTVLENPHYLTSVGSLSYAIKSPLMSFKNVVSNFGSMFGGQAKALSVDYDYGFPEFGFSLAEQTNSAYENPYAIASEIEPQLDDLNEEYGDCFKTTISSSGAIQTSEAVDYSELPDNCDDNNDTLVKYRFYIADMLAAKAGACYEGADEGACSELGFDNENTASNGGGETPAGAQIVGDPFSSSVDVECAPGTTNLGEFDGYTDGELVRHRLCRVENLPADENAVPDANMKAVVNSRVSGAVKAMVDAAAAEGIELSTISSFRTMADQQAKWDRNVNPPDGSEPDCSETEDLPTCDVARPGFSKHQNGTALDFAVDPAGAYNAVSSARTCADRMRYDSSDGWNWLFNHAEEYGYKQLSYEAWHWDPSSGNKACDSSQP